MTEAQLDQVRAALLGTRALECRSQPGQRLVDKNPLNLMRLPTIRRVFPNARIVLAIRHPRDVMLSCYLQHFRAPDFALLCSDIGKACRWLSEDFRLLVSGGGAAATGDSRSAL